MGGFFPLRDDMLRDRHWAIMTPGEKLFYLLILSGFSAHPDFPEDHFILSDTSAAVTLSLDVSTIRRARRRFAETSWVTCVPGKLEGGRRLATVYHSMKWADLPQSGEGVFYAPISRFTFETMLAQIRGKNFSHPEIWIYVCLVYFRHRFNGKGGSGKFFLPKRDLVSLARFKHSSQCVHRLHDRFKFASGERLFKFADGHQRFKFTGWNTFCEPDENENSARLEAQWRDEISQEVKRRCP